MVEFERGEASAFIITVKLGPLMIFSPVQRGLPLYLVGCEDTCAAALIDPNSVRLTAIRRWRRHGL